MDFLHILYEGFTGSLSTMLKIAVIVFPLMVVMQFIEELKLLDKFASVFAPVTRLLGISKNASFPLLAGLFLGMSYGSGVIIQSVRTGGLTKRDCYLVIMFLAMCHSLFDDNIIFVAIGADPIIIFFGRFFLALSVTIIISRLWKREPEPEELGHTIVDIQSKQNN
ncbi:MAG TPA: nucleoside recognition protein [Clostridia bacterium]|jgi:hypothetical protein|nr:nucleoside recognition protein [Clostridia bacterium]